MARAKKLDSLEDQISAAQAKMVKTKAEYEAACATLKELLAERENRRQKLLMSALAKSNKSFEDVLRFIESSDNDEE